MFQSFAPVVVWFRRNLRLADNPQWLAACQTGQPVLPVVVLDPACWEQDYWGFVRTGPFRTQFWLEAVSDLSQQIEQLGGRLLVLQGRPEDVLYQLVEHTEAVELYSQYEPADEEQRTQQRVVRRLQSLGTSCSFTWGTTLFTPEDLPFSPEHLPDVFTTFRQKVEAHSLVQPPNSNPYSPVWPEPWPHLPHPLEVLPTAAQLCGEAAEPDPRGVMAFPGGERPGQAWLKAWIWERDRLRTYKQTRNEMLGADYSSKLSPWLAQGCLSPRTVWAEVEAYEQAQQANQSTYWLKFELFWRDFFAFVLLRYGNELFQPGGLLGVQLDWAFDRDLFESWRNGQTGIPLIDANMRELQTTGYMSNRGRQNVASFLTKNLGLDWRAGAAWFEHRLVDYDVASNYGNWCYNAGVGNDARGWRYFNIPVQADKYDRGGAYVKHWLPQLEPVSPQYVHEPWRAPKADLDRVGVELGRDYPQPVVNLKQSVQETEQWFVGSLRKQGVRIKYSHFHQGSGSRRKRR